MCAPLFLSSQIRADDVNFWNEEHKLLKMMEKNNTSLGIGLSIALKAERGIPDWLWGAVAQWSEHLQLKQEVLGSIPSGCPGFFLFQLAY